MKRILLTVAPIVLLLFSALDLHAQGTERSGNRQDDSAAPPVRADNSLLAAAAKLQEVLRAPDGDPNAKLTDVLLTREELSRVYNLMYKTEPNENVIAVFSEKQAQVLTVLNDFRNPETTVTVGEVTEKTGDSGFRAIVSVLHIQNPDSRLSMRFVFYPQPAAYKIIMVDM